MNKKMDNFNIRNKSITFYSSKTKLRALKNIKKNLGDILKGQ